MDCLFIHDGDGKVCNLTGPQPGSRNDINAWYDSDVYKNQHKYLMHGHNIIADLMYYHCGEPLLCRYAYQEHYSLREIAFNKNLSNVRVISENWYAALKNYFALFSNVYKMKLSNFGIHVRSFSIITNIIITKQNPLRR